MKKGKLVVFGGIDGSGKTLQIKMLLKELKKRGIEVVATREHTRDGAAGKLIEKVVNHRATIDPVALQLCFVADRVDHVERIIKPALEKEKLVITDRYYETTVAYILPKYRKTFLRLHQDLCIRPDLTIIIEVDVDVALERIGVGRNKKTIFEKMEKLKRYKSGYKWFVKNSGDDCVVVNGSRNPEDISREIIGILKDRKLLV